MHHVFRPLYLPPALHLFLNLSSSITTSSLTLPHTSDTDLREDVLCQAISSTTRWVQPVFCEGATKSFMPSRSLQGEKKTRREEKEEQLAGGETSAKTGVCEVLGILAQSEPHAQGAFLRKGGKEDSELKGAQC